MFTSTSTPTPTTTTTHPDIFKDTIYHTRPVIKKAIADLSKEKVAELMNDCVKRNHIPIPLPIISDETLIKRFLDVYNFDLKVTDTQKMQRKIFYNILSGHFTNKVRVYSASKGHASAIDMWGDAQRLNLIRGCLGMINMDCPNFNENFLFLGIRNYIRMPGQFPVYVARMVYCHILSEPLRTTPTKIGNVYTGKVLDTSMGWGDRLVGAMTCPLVSEYVGCDPNKSLSPCYKAAYTMYKSARPSPFKFTPYVCGSEHEHSGMYKKEYYDAAFSSPPYLDIEQYKETTGQPGSKQAWSRYKTFDEFITKFIYKTIDLTLYSLKRGGIYAINVSAVCNPENKKETLSGKVIEYLSKKPGVIQKESLQFPIRNVKGGFVEGRSEIVYIFKKS